MSDLARSLRARLAAGVVRFTFNKISGETRPASGTTCFDLIPDAFRPKTEGRRTPKPQNRKPDVAQAGHPGGELIQ